MNIKGKLMDAEGMQNTFRRLAHQIVERNDGVENVVLIGMPGAGKSSCGRALARLLGRPFVDVDEAIALECGRAASGTFS